MMKTKRISLIIGLMGLALMGVMAMQFYFLIQSYRLQSELFDRSVSEALSSVVGKIEKKDAINFMERMKPSIKRISYPDKSKKHSHYIYNRLSDNFQDFNIEKQKLQNLHPEIERKQRRIASLKDSLKNLFEQSNPEDILSYQQVHVEEYMDEAGQIHGQITQINSPKLTAQLRRQLQPHLQKFDTARYVYNDPQIGPTVVSVPTINPLWLKEQQRLKKEQTFKHIKKLLEDSVHLMKAKLLTPQKMNVIEQVAEEYQKADEPLGSRIDQLELDSLLRFELQNKGIFLPFSYEITTASHDSLIYSNAENFNGEKPKFILASSYHTPIFTKEVVNDPGMLNISFPEKNRLILNRMTGIMGISGGLLLVLISCCAYTILLIFRQKKISEMKTEFINNMTHEFKTPVSTIMIASEALKDEEIMQDKSRVSRLAGIIYDENIRLGSHIERVLNIARIEQDDFKLDIKEIDVNEQIIAVVDSMALKIQKHAATVQLDLNASPAIIQADELHFTNVLYNLIDNAIKYSNEQPEIRISTKSTDNQLFIFVADKGIGMNRDQQAKIFEQFYRIPTGNLHDVKGFGLGLSYVNTIVKRLNGSISVRSEKDKGSVFELKFPLA
ncbi:sensor histidine kinase [Mucilaginibacter arboris]|uniref:histidine kinase n=1 Tax=Mucilaginibacter arboris TaxID=2682090 RepID=A0A7K1SZU5_9SPHI|nr:HAMP domain-containing sensor histidine kinase [Mucilaginibacter arboris]MVN22823.1 GHKL domain-containing protein [Mucilaginibacter arboris]